MPPRGSHDDAAFRVALQSLPDGTSYPANVVLNIASRQLEVRVTRSNYQKLAM
jgi:hypothetical protein